MYQEDKTMVVSRSESSFSIDSNASREPLHARMPSASSLDESIEILEEGHTNNGHDIGTSTRIQTINTNNGQKRIVSKQVQHKEGQLPHEPGIFSTFVDSFLEYVEDVFGLGEPSGEEKRQTHDPTVEAKANFNSFIN